MTAVVDCSIIIRLLSSRPGDDVLRRRLARTLHAPGLTDAEVSSVARGLAITTWPEVQPLQARVFELRHNFTAYDAMYVALAERLAVPLLTDDAKLAGSPGHHADIRQYAD